MTGRDGAINERSGFADHSGRPHDSWVMIRAESDNAVLWQASGYPWMTEDLPPVSPALLARIKAFGNDYGRFDAANETFPKPMYWEQRADFPVAAFNAEGRAVARALKAVPPSNWTVVYDNVDAWLRPRDTPIATCQLILPGDVRPSPESFKTTN